MFLIFYHLSLEQTGNAFILCNVCGLYAREMQPLATEEYVNHVS